MEKYKKKQRDLIFFQYFKRFIFQLKDEIRSLR
jgi:hypothetical protein